MMLLVGYGNPGRGDDGLGPAFAGRIAARALPAVETSIDYQLTVEHALQIAAFPVIVFADAEIGGQAPFRLTEILPATAGDVSSHSLSPEAVLALAQTLYGAAPLAYTLGITGAEFGRVYEGLSPPAVQNLDLAEAAFLEWFGSFSAAVAPEQAANAVGA